MARITTMAACLAGAILVSGCGFQPLYAERSGSGDVSGDLATVEISRIPDRAGQILRNELLDLMNPNGEPENPEYTLEVTLKTRKEKLGIQKDETATRANMTLTSVFFLREKASGAITYRSRAATTASYNIVDSGYETLSAERSALRRGLIVIADNINLRLSAYFNRLRFLRKRQ